MNMFCTKFAVVLAPVVLLLLIVDGAAKTTPTKKTTTNASTKKTTTNASTKKTTTNAPTNMTTGALVTKGNGSTTHPSANTTSHKYVAGPQFGGMLKRLVYVTLILSAVIGFYFLVKFCRSRRRKPRKYGVVKTPGDMEMRPLESDDDDDDEDVTMFNRKN